MISPASPPLENRADTLRKQGRAQTEIFRLLFKLYKMKTLKQLAAGFSLYQLQDIPAQWSGDYCRKDGGREVPEFLKTLKGYEVGNFFECKIQDKGTPKELYYIEYHTDIILKKDGSDLLILLCEDNRSKKYWFHPMYALLNKYNGIHYEIRNRATNTVKEPNQIGVFTEKKVNDWFQYCVDYIAALETVYAEIAGKNAEIEKQIADFIASVPDAEVQTWGNDTSVATPLFRVRFEHYKDQKYLNTKIEFLGNLDDVKDITNALQNSVS